MNRYMKEFLELKCAPDILEIVRPVSSGLEKEISESMAIIRKIKPFILKNPGTYNVVDLCAGNALTSIISVFLLPITNAVAIDKQRLERPYEKIQRFQYHQKNIFDSDIIKFIESQCFLGNGALGNSIFVASHPCRGTAQQIVKLFRQTPAKALCMIPCCIGKIPELQNQKFLEQRLGKYGTWALYLANQVNADIIEDRNIMSDKRLMILSITKEETKTMEKARNISWTTDSQTRELLIWNGFSGFIFVFQQKKYNRRCET